MKSVVVRKHPAYRLASECSAQKLAGFFIDKGHHFQRLFVRKSGFFDGNQRFQCPHYTSQSIKASSLRYGIKMRAAQHSRSMWIIALQPGKYISNGIDPCRQARFLYPPDQEHYGFLIRGFPSKTTDSASGITSNMPYLV